MADFDKSHTYKLGHYAESFASFYLRLKGYSIIKRRYKTKVGEIDIIAKKGHLTIFCEVKARKNYQTAADAITKRQKERISRAAEYYMSHLKTNRKNNKIENELYRCDAILISPWRRPVHIKNAW
ncbi:UNVERIFIED_CONTAM: hypothetical protein GTU68_048406 [Idotea baltica]|nr:hypothetical protein [Idotea baltica]